MKINKMANRVARIIETHYQHCGVSVKLKPVYFNIDYQRLIFEVILSPGTKVDTIFDRASDIGAALRIPLFHVFKEGVVIYLAISSKVVAENSLNKVLTSRAFRESAAQLPVALGYDLIGRMVVGDLCKMVHAMYAGATQTGKSSGLISLLLSLVSSRPASELNLVIVDVGGGSLVDFDGIQHLSYPVVTNRDQVMHVLSALVTEMDRRISLGEENCQELPHIVCVIDEFISLINNTKERQQRQVLRDAISDLLRRSGKVKMHLILATQDPGKTALGVDIGNITHRMAFRVDSHQTSVNILTVAGAEKLPGQGAMLYRSDANIPRYIQGAYMSRDDVKKLLNHIKTCEIDQSGMFSIDEYTLDDGVKDLTALARPAAVDDGKERELATIIAWVLGNQTVSVNQIKQHFSIGNRANDIMEKMHTLGLVGDKDSNKPRNVLVQQVEEISAAMMTLLEKYGYTVEAVTAVLESKRNDNNLLSGE